MSHTFPVQPPPATGDAGLDRWNRELYRMLRLYLNRLFAPGCGIEIGPDDAMVLQLDGTSLTCTTGAGVKVTVPVPVPGSVDDIMVSDGTDWVVTTLGALAQTALQNPPRPAVEIDHTVSPYLLVETMETVYGDTDGGVITINLKAGILGQQHRIKNVGSSANDITVDPDGSEQIDGGPTDTVPDGTAITIQWSGTQWELL
jgi:hypothetical protein